MSVIKADHMFIGAYIVTVQLFSDREWTMFEL